MRPHQGVPDQNARADAAAPGGEPLLAVRDLRVSFGGLVAVDIDELLVPEARIVGLVGSNGAGKTTLFDVISGFVSADRGSIRYEGDTELQRPGLSPDRRSRLGIARSFQNAMLFESMTVADTLAVACERHLRGTTMFGPAFRTPHARRQERLVQERVDELVAQLGLNAFYGKFISELSTGSRRIVDIGCVLAHRPRLLLLDEPSSGIAQREVEALENLLRRVIGELDCTLLVIEHDIPLIRSLADELYALETGRVIAHGDPNRVLADPEVVRSYLGTDIRAVERSGAMAQETDGDATIDASSETGDP